jgi:hypothetical protein
MAAAAVLPIPNAGPLTPVSIAGLHGLLTPADLKQATAA